MVHVVLGIGRSGVQDWLLQRISAVILAVFLGYVMVNWWCMPANDFLLWQQVFKSLCGQIITSLALVAMLVHAWIGMWTISTDYIKFTWLRLLVQLSIIGLLLTELSWGVFLLWK